VLYKIVTGILAKRIVAANPQLIHALQLGGLAQRSTSDALTVWSTILENARDGKKLLYATYCDISKAYDSVPFASQLLSYQRVGLPRAFQDFMADLHIDSPTQVLLAGQAPTEPFQPKRGFKQGDPLSVLGWLLFTQPLTEWLVYGIPARPDLEHAPEQDQGALNGGHLRRDSPPVEGYRLDRGALPVPLLLFMDDAAHPKSR
jgi:hypothetical protein